MSSLVVAFATAMIAGQARAQMQLPGAVGGSPANATLPPPAAAGAAHRTAERNPVVHAPNDDGLVGVQLARNGAESRITFQRGGDKALQIARLLLAGELISKPGEACRIEIAAEPISLKPLGRPAGMLRYEADLAACPFTFDVLDGAVLAQTPGNVCTFAQADCKVDPTGLWGPRGGSFSATQVKEIERARSKAETTVRGLFRSLIARAGGDKATVKTVAGEQAGFSSDRETLCRDYLREDIHGYCSLRVTDARAIALATRLNGPSKTIDGPKRKPKPKPRKPAPPSAAQPAPN